MRNTECLSPIRAADLVDVRLRPLLGRFEPALQKLLLLDRLYDVFGSAISGEGDGSVFDRLLASLGVRCSVAPEDLARIPTNGAAVLVANHPFGFLEGALLAAMLPRIRPDVRFMANSLLRAAPQLRDLCIFVNPFGGMQARCENRKPLRECLEWLAGGGLLVVFPAGEVAHLDWKQRAIIDPPWNPNVARLIRHSGCPAVPLFFRGANSLSFQLLGAVHPGLRTARLAHEFLNKRGRSIEVRIGRRVPPEVLRAFESDEEAIEYLRCRTYLLVNRGQPGRSHRPKAMRLEPCAEIRSNLVAEEIDCLTPDRLLAETEEMSVYCAGAAEIPHTLQEIGRLREVTFRHVGEGTGRALDLDRFDTHYLHLFLWHKHNRELVGGYRLGPTPDILPGQGVRGLYTSTLFHLHPELFRRIGPAIELGRSFIRQEYQRQYAPLLLLWKGICQYVSRRPDCPVLFGAVSISDNYSRASRELLMSFFEKQKPVELARLVKPRRPYQANPFRRSDVPWLGRLVGDVEALTDPISDLEPDGKGVPILIRQYAKLGGRVLGFNVDPRFSNALDGLILVDLREAPDAVLGRYMSRPGVAAFRAYHKRFCA